jgi:hypothetical protein
MQFVVIGVFELEFEFSILIIGNLDAIGEIAIDSSIPLSQGDNEKHKMCAQA